MSIDMEDDRVFKALAHPIRRRMLDALKEDAKTTGALAGDFPMIDRCTVMQHLKVLEEAGLVVARRKGRERWNHLDALPIKRIHDRWISEYAGHAISILDRLKADMDG